MNQETNYVSLRNYSDFSFDRATWNVGSMIKRAKELGYTTVGLTDSQSLSGAVAFYQECEKNNVKPILGVDAFIENDITEKDELPTDRISRGLFIVKNTKGYVAINEILSKAHIENGILVNDGDKSKSFAIKQSWLLERPELRENVYFLSGDFKHGEIPTKIKSLLEEADENKIEELQSKLNNTVSFYKDVFQENFCFEIQRIGFKNEDDIILQYLDLSEKYQVPIVATNGAQFQSKEEHTVNEARGCAYHGKTMFDVTRPLYASPHQYLKSENEMKETFKGLEFALENAALLAEGCSIKLEFGKNYLPEFAIPKEFNSESEFFRTICESGLSSRLEKNFPDENERKQKEAQYKERLNYEIDCIEKMGFIGYFLITQDLIRRAKKNEIAIGPGRGSGAGSLVAYSLGITNIDPIPHGLLFERFLNPERVSMPDFDIDVETEKRGSFLSLVKSVYGSEGTMQISAVNYSKLKAALDKARQVFAIPQQSINRLKNAIPKEDNEGDVHFQELYEKNESFRKIVDEDPSLSILKNFSQSSTLATHYGVHAGGIVIAPSDLGMYHFSSVSTTTDKDNSNNIIKFTQLDKNDIEKVGLVKMDFLGLSYLSVLKKAVSQIEKYEGVKINLDAIPKNDPQTLELFQKGDTGGSFQFNSLGMRTKILQQIPIRNFEDIAVANALYRPGPLETVVGDYVARARGEVPVPPYEDPAFEKVFGSTFGVPVFQEQIMLMAQEFAGFSLGEADILRKAMGKKDAELMKKTREQFVQKAENNGKEKEVAEKWFDITEKFAGYCFNKSHSIAYALLANQGMYLKSRYAGHYLGAYLDSLFLKGDDKDGKKVLEKTEIIQELRDKGYKVLAPNINRAFSDSSCQNGNEVYLGLSYIKGANSKIVESIVSEREENGAYKDITDFLKRTAKFSIDKKTMSGLVKAGAFENAFENPKDNHSKKTLLTNLKLDEKGDGFTHIRNIFAKHLSDKETSVLDFYPEFNDWGNVKNRDADKKTRFKLNKEEHVLDLDNHQEIKDFFQQKLVTWTEYPKETLIENYFYENEAFKLALTTDLLQGKLEVFNNLKNVGCLNDLNEIDPDLVRADNNEFFVCGVVSKVTEEKTKSGKPYLGVRFLGEKERMGQKSPYFHLFNEKKQVFLDDEDDTEELEISIKQEVEESLEQYQSPIEENESEVKEEEVDLSRINKRINFFSNTKGVDVYSKAKSSNLQVGNFVVLKVQVSKPSVGFEKHGNNINVKDFYTEKELELAMTKDVHILSSKNEIDILKDFCKKNRGNVPVVTYLPKGDKGESDGVSKEVMFKASLPEEYSINSKPETLAALRELFGEKRVYLNMASEFHPSNMKANSMLQNNVSSSFVRMG